MGDLSDVLINPRIQSEVRRRIIGRVPSLQPQMGIPQGLLEKLADLDRAVAEKGSR